MTTAPERRPRRSDLVVARQVVADADDLAALLGRFAGAPAATRERVREAYDASREDKVLARLDTVDVAALRDVTRERLRLGALTDAGITTVGEVAREGRRGLERVPGIGPQTAAHLLAATEQVARAVRESLRFRIDLTPTDPVATRLVQALHALAEAEAVGTRHRTATERFLAEHARVRPEAATATSPVRRFFAWGARGRRADAAVATLAAL
ncbi:hypothetical protein, partial [Cellulosimicrobium cellulans]|uniref:hypothetical protein n=1 Tax=Cellulosimicrobium cellulans TaxID=1710 RepID=UPI001C0D177C